VFLGSVALKKAPTSSLVSASQAVGLRDGANDKKLDFTSFNATDKEKVK
jgi:hypothetical protein